MISCERFECDGYPFLDICLESEEDIEIDWHRSAVSKVVAVLDSGVCGGTYELEVDWETEENRTHIFVINPQDLEKWARFLDAIYRDCVAFHARGALPPP